MRRPCGRTASPRLCLRRSSDNCRSLVLNPDAGRYKAHGPNWTLSVADDGVGMPKDAASATPGLSTSIVEALAKQLNARVQVIGGHPGTTVSIVHSQISAVDADADAMTGGQAV